MHKKLTYYNVVQTGKTSYEHQLLFTPQKEQKKLLHNLWDHALEHRNNIIPFAQMSTLQHRTMLF